jgi:hypothetical protein
MSRTWRRSSSGPLVKGAMRAVPWSAVGGSTGVALIFGGVTIVVGDAGARRALLTLSFALLAAASAFILDEPADLVADVTPTPRRAQTVARAPALVVPLAVGLSLVVATGARRGDPPMIGVLVALAGNVLLGFAVASVLRRGGGEPGLRASTATVVFLVIGPSLPSISRVMQTYPSSSPGGDQRSNVFWLVVGSASVVALQLSTSRNQLRLGESFRRPLRDR